MISKLKTKIEKILHIPVEECEKYFSNTRTPKRIAAKDFFVKEGEVCREMAFVEKGALRMFYISPQGKETNVQFFFENDFVASYQSFLAQSQGKYFIQALEDCQLITISRESLQSAYAHSAAWQQFGRIVAEKVFMLTEQRTESLLFLSAEQRYLDLLRKRPIVFERIPLYHIASYLGIQRESLSRLRKKLAIVT